jgi:hypothetical protein
VIPKAFVFTTEARTCAWSYQQAVCFKKSRLLEERCGFIKLTAHNPALLALVAEHGVLLVETLQACLLLLLILVRTASTAAGAP